MRPKLSDDVIVSLDTTDNAACWQREFNVSLPALKLAMMKAGHRYNDIREELGDGSPLPIQTRRRIMRRFVGPGVDIPGNLLARLRPSRRNGAFNERPERQAW